MPSALSPYNFWMALASVSGVGSPSPKTERADCSWVFEPANSGILACSPASKIALTGFGDPERVTVAGESAGVTRPGGRPAVGAEEHRGFRLSPLQSRQLFHSFFSRSQLGLETQAS